MVKLSDAVVETYFRLTNLSGFFAHQLRWARGVRDCACSEDTSVWHSHSAVVVSIALIASHGASWAAELFALTLFLRLLVAWVVGWAVLRDRQVSNYVWLIPLRDLVAAVVWLVSFFGHTVVWRGERFQLKKGRLSRARRLMVGRGLKLSPRQLSEYRRWQNSRLLRYSALSLRLRSEMTLILY